MVSGGLWVCWRLVGAGGSRKRDQRSLAHCLVTGPTSGWEGSEWWHLDCRQRAWLRKRRSIRCAPLPVSTTCIPRPPRGPRACAPCWVLLAPQPPAGLSSGSAWPVLPAGLQRWGALHPAWGMTLTQPGPTRPPAGHCSLIQAEPLSPFLIYLSAHTWAHTPEHTPVCTHPCSRRSSVLSRSLLAC